MKILTNGPISKSPRLIRIVWVVTMMICSVFLLGSFQTEAGDKPVPPKADDTKLTDKTGEKLPASIDFVPMDTMPEMVIESAPVYPKEAKDKKIEGDVWVKALILKDGSVHEAQIAKSSGHALLDKSAVTTAKKNRFKPGYKDDKPVACWVTYRVSFVLEEKKK